MKPLGDHFTTVEWIRQYKHAYACKMRIVGTCIPVETDYRSAVVWYDEGKLGPEEYLYELRQLVHRLECIIARDKSHKPQAAPVIEPVAVANVRKPRAPKTPRKGVPNGVETTSRKGRRQAA